MIYLVALVVLVLAAARAARLASKDDITISVRLWIDGKWGPNSFLSRLVWCHWCSGIWMSGLLSAMGLAIAAVWGGWPWGLAAASWLPLTLGVAYAGARLVDMEGD